MSLPPSSTPARPTIIPALSPPPPAAPMHRRPRELTLRTGATLAMLTLLISLSLTLAHASVFPTRPRLRAVAAALAALAEWSAYAVVRRSQRQHLSARTRPPPAPRCAICRAPKPPRTHHCTACAACTPRMCHHCGVLGVCVGAHNYKPFVLLLLYGTVAAALLVGLCAPEAVGKVRSLLRRERPLSVAVLLWLQLFYMQVCMTAILGGLLVFHLYLIAINRTVLEACVIQSFGKVFPPWRREVVCGEKGLQSSFHDVFGDIWIALLPVVRTTNITKVDYTYHSPA